MEAIEYAEKSIQVTLEQDEEFPARIDRLSCFLSANLMLEREEREMLAAIDLGRRAVIVTPDGHEDRAGFCHNLSCLLSELYDTKGSPEVLNEAISYPQQAAHGPTAEPTIYTLLPTFLRPGISKAGVQRMLRTQAPSFDGQFLAVI